MKICHVVICCLLAISCSLSAQYVEIDRISWADYTDGTRTGVSTGGAQWLADNDMSGNQDGTGFFGTRGGRFVWDDWEGKSACPCVAGSPTLSCGNNDNSLFTNITASFPYCEIRISFDIIASGSVECGTLNDKDKDDGYSSGLCPTDFAPDWGGTDFMTIRFVDNATGDVEVINICGAQGAGRIERTFPITSGATVISIFFAGGTQDVGEVYELSDIVIEGVRSSLPLLLNARMVTGLNNTICENSGVPIKLLTIANSNNQFQWSGPNGFNSSDPQPEIATYTTAASGVYNVTVTDANNCQLIDDVNVTVLAASDSECTMTPVFIYNQGPVNSIVCSSEVLPSTSDNGITGVWTPSPNLSAFAGQILEFTFTPDNPNVPLYRVTLNVDDISRLDTIGLNPPQLPIFCNADISPVDLISTFQLDTSLSLRVNGANSLFDFVPSNDFLNNYIPQFSNFDFIGVSPGNYTFFIEAVTDCGETASDEFTFEIIGPADPIRIDTSICSGDTLIFQNYRFYSDSIIFNNGGGACDTAIVVKLTINNPGIYNGNAFPGNNQFLSCASREWFYVYDSIVNGQRGIVVADRANEPANPNYVDIIRTSISGLYTLPFLTAHNGCDTLVRLLLNFSNEGSTNLIEFDLCSNKDTLITYAGADYRMSANTPYRYILGGTGSCDAGEIIANIIPVLEDTIRQVYCADETPVIDGETFSRSRPTGRIFRATGSNGCSSSTLVDLTFLEPVGSSVTRRLCPGEIVQVGDAFFNTTVTDSLVLIPRAAASGCDSTVLVNLEFIRAQSIIVDTTLCAGEQLIIDNEIFDANRRTGTVRIASSLGCDSIVYQVQLGYRQAQISVSDTICFGESSIVGTQSFNTTGVFPVTLTSSFGCDSTVNLTLFVRPENTFSFQDEICEGLTYPFGAQILTATGVYTEVFTSTISGCDSTVTLDFTLLPTPIDSLDMAICQGELINLGNQVINSPGVFNELFVTTDGCDSLVVLTVTVSDTFLTQVFDTILLGETSTVAGQTFDTEGVFTIPLSSVAGCDSTILFNLNVITQVFVDVDTILCFGEEFTVGNNVFSTSTTTSITLTGSTGFDSIVNLNLIVLDENRTNQMITICEGDSVIFDNRVLSTTGRFTGVFASGVNRCDSIVDLDLIVNPVFNESITRSICAGDSILFNGAFIKTADQYIANLMSSTGCDSTVTLEVLVNDTFRTVFFDTIVRGESLDLLGRTLTEPGQYSVTIPTTGTGCDSTLVLDLFVIEEVNLVIDTTICPGLNVRLFNNSYSTDTMQVFTRQGVNGAPDTIVDLTIRVIDLATLTSTLTETICHNESFNFAGINRTTSGTYRDTLLSATGCDSIVTLSLTVLANPSIGPFSRTICVGSVFTIGNNTYDTDGTFTDTLTSIAGCDSVVTVMLSVSSEFVVNLDPRLCPNETFTVGNNIYNVTGQYADTLVASIGCDSIINTNLVILEPNIVDFIDTICAGESVTIGDQIFDQSIVTSITLPSSENCDSTININLTVLNEINTVIIETICFGESRMVGNSVYTTTGIHITQLTAANGCDSIVRLDLTVRPEAVNNLAATVCSGDAFIVDMQTFSMAGSYTVNLLNAAGCDSTVNLTLSVVDQFEIGIDQTICIGEAFIFAGQTLTEAGIYRDTLSSIIGCDSIVTLNLTVIPDFSLNISNIVGTCDGISNGSFTITGVTGSAVPVVIDGLPTGVFNLTQVPTTISNLAAGTYDLVITDGNGCMSGQSVTITNDRNSLLTIVSISTSSNGDYELGLNFSGMASAVLWDNVPGLSCFDCPNPTIRVTDVTTIGVTVTDVDGCTYRASITLDVNNIGNIYIPSIFSPEGSVGNSRFFLQGENGEQAVYDMSIFDRWGNKVYEVLGAQLNDPSFGWNGRYNDSPLNPGVFVYSAIVRSFDGAEESYKGSITLIK